MSEKFPENVLTALREARETGTPVITQELADAIEAAGAEIPNGVVVFAENPFDTPEIVTFKGSPDPPA